MPFKWRQWSPMAANDPFTKLSDPFTKIFKSQLPHCVLSLLETVPAGQEVQEAAPVCSVIEFSEHLVQLVTALFLYVPALQSTEE